MDSARVVVAFINDEQGHSKNHNSKQMTQASTTT